MKKYSVQISDSVAGVLARSSYNDGIFKLPERLERPTYNEVSKVLAAIGGKWNRSKGGFPFDEDPRPALGAASDAGHIVNEKRLRQAFFTPPESANSVCMHAYINTKCSVLEPSAGSGNLVRAASHYCPRTIHAVEIHAPTADKIKGVYPGGLTIHTADFMEWQAPMKFDRVVMNPPFTAGQAGKHILRAFDMLVDGGRLVAIMPLNRNGWFSAIGAVEVERLPSGTFREEGTNVETMIVIAIK